MTVYVDDMQAKFGRMKMCHCLADTEEELFAMMDKIGVDRKWYQTKKGNLHFDIALSMRAKAVRLGAVEITWKQASAMNAIRRMTGVLGEPNTAIDLYLALNNFPKDEKGRVYVMVSKNGGPEERHYISDLVDANRIARAIKENVVRIASTEAQKETE